MNIREIRQTLASDGLVLGLEVNEMRSPAIAQIYAAAGFDFIMIDQEHTSIELQDVARISTVANLCNIAPFVRIPEISYSSVCRVLDQGVQGIVVPRVTHRDQVLEVLDMIRYHPQGHRGLAIVGPNTQYRGADGQEFVDNANRSIMLVVQIESDVAVKSIDDILTVPGVDVAFVGPVDLSLSVGLPGNVDHPKVDELIQEVVAKARENGIASGLAMADIGLLKKWIKVGARFLWMGNEAIMIIQKGREYVHTLRSFADSVS